jgi:hypothetical protein
MHAMPANHAYRLVDCAGASEGLEGIKTSNHKRHYIWRYSLAAWMTVSFRIIG